MLRAGLPSAPHAPIASQPAHYALPSKSQIRWLRAVATVPGKSPQTRHMLNIGGAAALACRSASGTSHNTYCVFGRSSHINSFRADYTPPAGPFGTEFMSHNMALCAIPLLHCHADCYSAPSRSCGQSPRQFAGILHANSAAPPHMQPVG
jgi:hypothetical protein